jgi:hypothetical protein
MSEPLITIEVRGLDSVMNTLLAPILLAEPLRVAFERCGIAVSNEAKTRAPVFRGRLRQSIKWVTDTAQVPQFVRIGPNVDYAYYVHEGRRPGSWPPISAIRLWVERRGIDASPYAIARSIARRGIPGRPFLTDGLRAAEPAIRQSFDECGRGIEANWSQAGVS